MRSPQSLCVLAALSLAVGCDDDPAAEPAAVDAAADAQALDAGAADGALPSPNACTGEGTPAATARCRAPTLPAAHYVAQAELYFDTLDARQPVDRVPTYADDVARWEWPPWLLLTGYGRDDMIATGVALRDLDPSTVPERDCRFFDTEPFARCVVTFEYEGGLCPIYEEFVFNDAGEMTFIEAWSVQPGDAPAGWADDPWGEGDAFPRLSTRVPGLGTPVGTVDLDAPWALAAAEADPDVADLFARAANWRLAWAREYGAADPNFFAIGCGWPIDAPTPDP